MVDQKAFVPGETVCCPHCAKTVVLVSPTIVTNQGHKPEFESLRVGHLERSNSRFEHVVKLSFSACPGCKSPIIQAGEGNNCYLLVPRVARRRPIHASTPEELRKDYLEAIVVLGDSPKASAALSRRCLQTLLVLQKAKKSDLVDQLEEVRATLPSYVADYIDHIRQLGNISAHARKSKATGEIVEVQPGEAEWMLELLEELFDHYYAKPAEAAAKQAALNAKFADAGKLKT